MRRRFVKRSAPRRPQNVQWADVHGEWLFASQATTGTSVLIQLQAPAALNALTADPPEDLTVLRVVGDFNVTLAGAAAGNWSLALMVADVTWTPGANIHVDNDKRILWQMTYQATNATSDAWVTPNLFINPSAAGFPHGMRECTHIDISPKVKIESGKALYLIAYENIGGATLSTSSQTMRVLYKRSGRR